MQNTSDESNDRRWTEYEVEVASFVWLEKGFTEPFDRVIDHVGLVGRWPSTKLVVEYRYFEQSHRSEFPPYLNNAWETGKPLNRAVARMDILDAVAEG